MRNTCSRETKITSRAVFFSKYTIFFRPEILGRHIDILSSFHFFYYFFFYKNLVTEKKPKQRPLQKGYPPITCLICNLIGLYIFWIRFERETKCILQG